MSTRAWRRTTLVALVGALALGACSGGSTSATPAGPTTPATAADGGVLLRADAAAGAAGLQQAATVVKARLGRMGVADAVVNAVDGGLSVRSSADPYELRAAAQPRATTIAPVVSSTVGACTDGGTPRLGPASRCDRLGPATTGVAAVATASAEEVPGSGWRVALRLDPARYSELRTALDAADGGQVAVVADDAVVLVFRDGVPGQRSTIGPPLDQETARLAAAALVVDTDLPVALTPPPLPEPSLARTGVDFWTTALGVDVCGTWLADAPSTRPDTGVHTHGDGLVYVHPFTADEAGPKATLGLFLQRGGWSAGADELRLWDGQVHRSGDTCPDGRTARVSWWVDGVRQDGDPSSYLPRNGQVVALALVPDGEVPGDPPQLDALVVPPLTAAAG